MCEVVKVRAHPTLDATADIPFSLSPTSAPTINNRLRTLHSAEAEESFGTKTPHDNDHQTPPISWNWAQGLTMYPTPQKGKRYAREGKKKMKKKIRRPIQFTVNGHL